MLVAPSDVALDCLQGVLVLAPTNRASRASSRLLGVAIPGLALVGGVFVASAAGGASFLTWLAAIATPLLAAAAGWARSWPAPWLPALAVPVLYVIDWVEPHAIGDPADLAILQTDHADYKTLTPADIPGVKLLVDGRNASDPALWAGTPRIVVGTAG